MKNRKEKKRKKRKIINNKENNQIDHVVHGTNYICTNYLYADNNHN